MLITGFLKCKENILMWLGLGLRCRVWRQNKKHLVVVKDFEETGSCDCWKLEKVLLQVFKAMKHSCVHNYRFLGRHDQMLHEENSFKLDIRVHQRETVQIICSLKCKENILMVVRVRVRAWTLNKKDFEETCDR